MEDSYVAIHQRKENGRMMLESIENGPLVYSTIEENGQIRKKKYAKLIEQEKLQDDCDVQATNIVLQEVEFPQLDSGLVVPSFLPEHLPIQETKLPFKMTVLLFYKFKGDKGEGHMARQCTQPKRPRNSAWFKEKTLLVQAHESGQVLDEEQLAFLIDLGIIESQVTQTTVPQNTMFHTDDLDAYDSDCDDISSSKAVLMANLSSYDSDVLFEKAQRIKPTLFDGIVISKKHDVISVVDEEETLILEELEAKDVSIAKLKKHIENLKGKNAVEKDALPNNAKVITPRMFKLDLEPLSPKVLKNRDAHIDYIKHSREHADTLRELGERTRALRALNSDLNSALMQNPHFPIPFVPPTKNDWKILFQPMFDEHFNHLPSVTSPVPAVVAPEPADSTGTPSSTPIDQDTPSPSRAMIITLKGIFKVKLDELVTPPP
nr:hypothetical protein [Tanacetum cinerariifolium]